MTGRGGRRPARSSNEIPIGMARPLPHLPLGGLRFKTCQWPLWHGRPNGRFCAKPIQTSGAPYCDEHMARAHTTTKPKDIET